MLKQFKTGTLGLLTSVVVICAYPHVASAVVVNSGGGEITWDQTQSFNIDEAAAAPIWWYEGQGLPPPASYSYSRTLSFIGAPSGFTIGGTNYSLTEVSVITQSTLTGSSKTYAHDTDVYSHAETFGSFSTSVQAILPGLSTLAASGSNYWPSVASAEGWFLIGVIPFPSAATITTEQGNTTYLNSTVPYDANLSFFTSQNEIQLLLQKDINIAMTGVQANDTDAYVQQTADRWYGSVSFRYTFSETSVVPLPSALIFFISGIATLIGLRTRRLMT